MPRYWTVDVFAERPYAGNQLAVVLDDASLSTEAMQAIALEFGYSETTFVAPAPGADGSWPTRIFTPVTELPFAGHPTLGTAWIVREQLGAEESPITLELGAGKVPVTFDASGDVWLTSPRPTVGEQYEHPALARLLGLDAADLDETFPIEDISTGLPFTFVPVRDREALDRAVFQPQHAGHTAADAPFVFCRDTVAPTAHIHARLFAPTQGVAEDPATGSANACFALYLLRHGYLDPLPSTVVVEQGFKMGRRSKLQLRASGSADAPHIEVGGGVFPICEGRLFPP